MATSTPQTKEERLALINENLAEVLNQEIIEKILDEGRNPKIYWGMAACNYVFLTVCLC